VDDLNNYKDFMSPMPGSLDDHPLFTGNYLFTDLPSGRRLAIWRVGIFPVGSCIEWRVFKKVEDQPNGGEHWTVTEDHETFRFAMDFPEFCEKNGLEGATWWNPPSGTVIDV